MRVLRRQVSSACGRGRARMREDQIVGSLLIVVLPGVLVAMVAARLPAMVARAATGRRSAEPVSS